MVKAASSRTEGVHLENWRTMSKEREQGGVGGPLFTAPVPGSDLAKRLDARRRIGLGDPDWSVSTEDREYATEVLEAVQAALDDPTFGARRGVSLTEKAARHIVILEREALDPFKRGSLTEVFDRLAKGLYGDRPPPGPADVLSVVEPRTGQVSISRAVIPVAMFIAAGVIPFIAHASGAIVLGVLGLVFFLTGFSTYRVVNNGLRLTSSLLTPDSDDVVAIEPSAASYSLAHDVSSDVEVILAAQQERSNDDTADLLAERDRIIAELVELDSRKARLVAIEEDTDAANAADHARLVKDVQHWRQQLVREAGDISTQAAPARAAIEASARERRQSLDRAEREHRRARARSELDELAAPPPRMIQNPEWRDDTGPQGVTD